MTSPAKNIFIPFHGFLENLRNRGFVITPEHHLRVRAVLEGLGPDCAPSDLKLLLCPLFAVNAKQQEEFYRAFDLYYASLNYAFPGKKEDRIPARKAGEIPEEISPVQSKHWPYVMTALLLILAMGTGIYFYIRPEPVPGGVP
ncbi:MAG: hypothetical protein V2I97_11075, partial [Desulfococcaceae bacterium]|nr:hypothetical protein [Desulfococcaceae bacterium]